MNALWERANQIIPGGNHLFSKTPDRYAPGRWPPYYRRASGIEITAQDGKVYQDFSVMGAGNSVLGYADEDVDTAVGYAIKEGNVSTLNCTEEVELAEVMLNLNPKMDMVRFGRSGNDACQIALRIASEYSDNKEYAICGYHGWQVGHPPQLDFWAHPFEYGDIEAFYDIMDLDEPGAVIMECIRTKPVDIPFLNNIRKMTEALNIPLIFDEVASGFRCNRGGYHQLIGVQPDIALYGKAMGNGYAISAVVGKEEIMKSALKTFISSMQWSERLGYTAGLATIWKMQETDAQIRIQALGKTAKDIWQIEAGDAGLKIEVSGMDPLATFTFVNDPERIKMTTFTQEMLKRGYLAGPQFYPSICHNSDNMSGYADAVGAVFKDIASGKVKLEGEPARPGFKRLV